MSFLHDSFWQFIISTIIAVLGIIIPLIASKAQSKSSGGSMSAGYTAPSGRWIAPTIVISIFLILFIAFNSIIFTLIANAISSSPFHSSIASFTNLTSGTPDQTLSSYCSDIQSGAYQQAYDEYSANLKNQVSSSQLTQMWSGQHLDGCTHDTINTTGNSANTTLSTHDFFTKAVANYKVTLLEDGNNGWKIDSITQE